MSRILTILIALLVLTGSFLVIRYAKDSYKILPIDETDPLTMTSSNIKDWRKYSPDSGSFQALFPALPQHVTNKIADPIKNEPRLYDMYAAADKGGAAYLISAVTFPNHVQESEVKTVLRSAVNDALARNNDNKLKMTKEGKFHEFNSLDFALENGDVTVAGKAILNGDTLYVLSAIDKTEHFNVDNFNSFVNSFSIIAPSSEPLKKLEAPSDQNLKKKNKTKEDLPLY